MKSKSTRSRVPVINVNGNGGFLFDFGGRLARVVWDADQDVLGAGLKATVHLVAVALISNTRTGRNARYKAQGSVRFLTS